MNEELENTSPKLERDEKGRLLPNQESLNPSGRPKGSISVLSEIKKYLKNNPDKMEELVKYYLEDEKMRGLLLQMIDGRPHQSTDSKQDITVIPFDDI